MNFRDRAGRGIALLVALVCALALAGTAGAVAAKFHSASSSVTGSGALAVSFDERGLGEGDINYRLDATGTATWACINRGGNHPQAANKETSSFPVVATASFQSKNGRVQATITSSAPAVPSGFSCPGGQRLVLASVSYTNITLNDLTNGSSTNVADASRTFFTV